MIQSNQVEDIENKAIIEQSKKKIEQNQKFIDSMEELAQAKENASNNFAILKNQCIELQNIIKNTKDTFCDFNTIIDTKQQQLENVLNETKTNINNSAISVNQNIAREINKSFLEQASNFSKSFIDIIGKFEKLQKELTEHLKNHSDTLIKEMQEEKARFRKLTNSLFIEYGIVFFISLICSIITALYCINYQFHNIFFLDTMQVGDIVKFVINVAIGIVLVIVIQAVFKHFTDK